MNKSKLHVSFCVNSIDLNDQITAQIKSNNMIKLNITQKPLQVKQEYLINHIEGLSRINHEFKIVGTPKSMKDIILSIRKVEKKWCLENLFSFNLKKDNYKVNSSINPYTGKPNEVNDSNIQYKYEQLANSLLGYCKINIDNLEIGVNNSIIVDIITKKDSKIIGHANVDIYKWNEKNMFLFHNQKCDNIDNSRINFEDPECILFD